MDPWGTRGVMSIICLLRQTANILMQHGWLTEAITLASSRSSLCWALADPEYSELVWIIYKWDKYLNTDIANIFFQQSPFRMINTVAVGRKILLATQGKLNKLSAAPENMNTRWIFDVIIIYSKEYYLLLEHISKSEPLLWNNWQAFLWQQ